MIPNKIILYRDGSCCERRILENFRKINIDVIELARSCQNYDLDAELAQELLLLIHSEKADTIFSVDYYPIIAEIAHTVAIPYISWIIDAPHYTLYSQTSRYDECYIFHFDREEAERLTSLGRPHVIHQPLASDPDHFAGIISAGRGNAAKYTAEISFLGSSYQNEYDYFAKQSGLTDYERGYFDALINAQLHIYGISLISGSLSEAHVKSILNACDLHRPNTYDLSERIIAENALEKRVSVLERQEMITHTAQKFGITLYSYEDSFPIPGVSYKGYADYDTQMPLVFANSRINLNTTLRQIHSGIPLRALDIMACGGFLLTNYQAELLEYFEPGRDLEIYESIEDMLDKCDYYLAHEKARKEIAGRGAKIIHECFSYEHALRSMLDHV